MPLAILSLCFSPLLEYRFIKKRALVSMETSTREGSTRLSTLSVHCQCELYHITVSNDTICRDAVRRLFVLMFLRIWTAHFSVFDNQNDQIITIKTRVNPSHQAGPSEEAWTGRLSASKGTGSQGNSHLMSVWCGSLCKVSSFVSHWTSERSVGVHHYMKLFFFFFFFF